MHPAQIPKINPDEFSRCEERKHKTDHRNVLSPIQKTDAALKGSIERALRKDDVLRAIESDEIEVYVKDRVVHMSGHISGTTSQKRIQNAIRVVPGLLGIQNNLVLDDNLTFEAAASLRALEYTYGCKFFTGASHGVVSLNGTVHDENVKWLAEKCVAANPNVRAVINNIQIPGTERKLEQQPFLQPTIRAIIYFLDGISGVVRQVIINPNNRRVVAMILWGEFPNPKPDISTANSAEARSPARLIVVPMDLVRYMTKASGFLYINSRESNQYLDFNPARFSTPENGWKAPYPYCPDDVLFSVEKLEVEYQMLEQIPRSPSALVWEEQPLTLQEEFLATDSLGG